MFLFDTSFDRSSPSGAAALAGAAMAGIADFKISSRTGMTSPYLLISVLMSAWRLPLTMCFIEFAMPFHRARGSFKQRRPPSNSFLGRGHRARGRYSRSGSSRRGARSFEANPLPGPGSWLCSRQLDPEMPSGLVPSGFGLGSHETDFISAKWLTTPLDGFLPISMHALARRLGAFCNLAMLLWMSL